MIKTLTKIQERALDKLKAKQKFGNGYYTWQMLGETPNTMNRLSRMGLLETRPTRVISLNGYKIHTAYRIKEEVSK